MKPLARLTHPNKVEYASLWGYSTFLPVYQGAEVDHGFGRLQYCLDRLPHCDWLWYLDADTLIMAMNSPIEKFCYPDADLVACWDENGFQSGSMLMRNCSRMEYFLQDVLEMKEDTIKRPGFMASSDQGAMVRKMSGQDTYLEDGQDWKRQVVPVKDCQKGGIRVVEAPKRFNQYLDDYRIGDEVIHLCARPMEDRILWTERLLKQIVR